MCANQTIYINLMNQKSFYAVALATLLLFAVTPSQAQVTERQRPTEWSKLVPGARFMDRFRPMEGNDLRSDVWGAYYVKPRFVDNGIED